MIQDDHIRCADFEESNCKCFSKYCLLMIRILLFVPMFAMLVFMLYKKPKDVAYFESYWTFTLTVISLFTSMMAHYSKWWHSLAVFTSEVSMCFNICVVPVFWIARYQAFVNFWQKNESYDVTERIYLFQLAFTHSMPMLTSVIELLITKMCFLKKDSKWVFLVGILYIPVNYYGSIDIGQPVYNWNYLDWKNPKTTFACFVF